ncbi:MAG: hypothetical protein Q9227_005516 [Pyrenula ochraceoflavens]
MARDRSQIQSTLANLLPKLEDPDSDIRFMSLSDLANALSSPASSYISSDTHTSSRIVEGLLKALNDGHGEVQNQALKCMAPLGVRVPHDTLSPLLDKLSTLQPTTSDVSGNIRDAAMRTLVAALPQPQAAGQASQEAQKSYSAISRVLIPRLVGKTVLPNQRSAHKLAPGMLQPDKEKAYSADAVDLLIEVVRCFGVMLQSPELVELLRCVMSIIESPTAGSVVKKRSLAAIGVLAIYLDEEQLSHFVSNLIESFRSPHLTTVHRRYLIATVAALAKSSPSKFGPYLKTLAPFILSAIGKEEFEESAEDSDDSRDPDPEVDELRETALITLEAIIASCSLQMQPFVMESIDAALRFLRYDPNMATEDDEDMGGVEDNGSDDGVTSATEDDEDDEYGDFDGDGEMSDVDDVSWKVRRCSSKVLYAIITGTVAVDNATLYGQVVPSLISRLLREREENVKVEVLGCLSGLVRKSGTGVTPASTSSTEPGSGPASGSRKRRRQDSEANIEDIDLSTLAYSKPSPPISPSSPQAGPQAEIAALTAKMVHALTTMWRKATIPLKQAAVLLLRYLALSRNGALADHLQQIEDPIADALKVSSASQANTNSTSTTTATGASLQIEALALISAVTETNSASSLLPFLMALIPAVATTVRGRNFKVSSEALGTIEQMIKALTPPRLQSGDKDHAMQLGKLSEVVFEKVTDNNADLEVRHKAVLVAGVLLARTSSTSLLPAATRANGLHILSDRLKNETTRLPSARAIAIFAPYVKSPNDLTSEWLRDVSLELGANLRKADRSLRGSCLDALKGLGLNNVSASMYDAKTIHEIAAMLLPLLTSNDFHLLTPALIILAKIIPTDPKGLVGKGMIDAFCTIVASPITGAPLKAFLFVVKVVGEQGVGAELMNNFLKVGVSGDSAVVGKAIGTLAVFGGSNMPVGIQDLQAELSRAQDVPQQCLTITILGEIGFRLGPNSPLSPDIFVKGLSADSDKVRLTAAVAFGSAGASNIKEYLPLILHDLGSGAGADYLLLHSLREILQHQDRVAQDVAPFAKDLWEKLFTASEADDNRAVGAECIGRLSLIEPGTYVPQLQSYLQNKKAEVRGTVITAFRYTLTDTSDTYNTLLKSIMVPLLTVMLSDSDLGNRRLAITTLNSAIHNKPALILPELDKFLPIVLQDSTIKPELIRVVSYGPFKMDVDDGLDLRKSCYETFYALLELPTAAALSLSTIFDRIVVGVVDDHDIRTLCNLLVIRLAQIAPEESRQRLTSLSENFKVVLSRKPKDTAVKQEIEKMSEANAGVVRTTLELERHFGNGGEAIETMGWKSYLEWLRRDFAHLIREVESGH